MVIFDLISFPTRETQNIHSCNVVYVLNGYGGLDGKGIEYFTNIILLQNDFESYS